jgi:riboflavin kinase / FMN adenylyltransferase
MRVERGSLAELRPHPASALTMGSFDGLHLAHQALVRRVVERARERDLEAALLTFEPHPREVLRDGRPAVARLSTPEEKLELLEASGLDRVILLRFTPELAGWEAERFIREGLVGRIGLRLLVVGDNHAFGRGRGGDRNTLLAASRALDFELEVLEPVRVEGERVSSTRVRQVLLAGGAELAARLLGRPYRLTGRVVGGQGRGRQLGFPTANLQVPDGLLLPADGVYAVRVGLEDGRRLGGMLNLGARPTFGETERIPEVHLFGFTGSLYEQPLRVDILGYIRDTMRFNSREQLRDQLREDRIRIQEWLATRDGGPC